MSNGENKETLDDFVVTIKAPKDDNEDLELLPEYEKIPAVIKSVKPKGTKNGTRASFCFELKGDYEGRRAWGSVPVRDELSEDSHLYKWMSAILGKEGFEIGDQVRLGDTVGHAVYIVIKNADEKNEQGKPYQNVVEVVGRDAPKEDVSKNTKTTTTTKKKDAPKEDVSQVLDETVASEPVVEKEKTTTKKNDVTDSEEISEDELPF